MIKLFCNHNNLLFLGNIYGDLIYKLADKKHIYRSAYKCNLCNKIILKETLEDSSLIFNESNL